MTTLADRLQLALAAKKATGVSQNAVETAAGLNPGYLATLKKGTRSPSYEIVVALADALDVNLDWLAAERGPMVATAGQDETPIGRARAAGLALGYSAAAIEAGVSAAIADNDTGDAWEILGRIRTKSRVPAPGRMIGPPTVTTYAANEDEGPATVIARPGSPKPEAPAIAKKRKAT